MLLHLQALMEGRWQRAAVLDFPDERLGSAGRCIVEYDFDYAYHWIGRESPLAAVSLRFPVAVGPAVCRRWPAFLDDLRPMAAAKRWWLRKLGLADEPASELKILSRGTVAPIGNLRVEEAIPPTRSEEKRFPRAAVIEREGAFLEYAAEAGANVGGATGAGGDSPKLLLRQNAAGEVWIDVWQDDLACPDVHYLVKFARGKTERDRTILRSEHVYYQALNALGVATISSSGLALEEGPGGPSLWLPRFDIGRRDGRELRLGVESLYALLEAEAGSYQTHQQALKALEGVVSVEDWPAVRLDYLRRELLNLVFGNTDNHCRNIAVLKTGEAVRLAPIYDFAPMKMDPEGVTRTTRWEGFEAGGEVDWPRLLRDFGAAEAELRHGLGQLAERLRDLPDLLAQLGLPEETLDFPGIGLRSTEKKLRAWSLL